MSRHRGVIVSGVLLQFERHPRGMGALLKLTIRTLPVSRTEQGAVRRALNSMTFRVTGENYSNAGDNPEKSRETR